MCKPIHYQVSLLLHIEYFYFNDAIIESFNSNNNDSADMDIDDIGDGSKDDDNAGDGNKKVDNVTDANMDGDDKSDGNKNGNDYDYGNKDVDDIDHKIDNNLVEDNKEADEGDEDLSRRSVSSLSSTSGAFSQTLTPQENSAIDVKIALLNIMNEKESSDVITINGVQHIMEFDSLPNPDGRGIKTWMFNSEFSSSIPPLYWYRFYSGYVSKHLAFIGMCMTECGNFFVGILETRCPKPRYDAVVYYKRSNECKIYKDHDWKRKFVLCPHAPLDVDVEVVKR